MKSEFYQSGNLKFSDKKTVNFDRNNNYYKDPYKLALNILNSYTVKLLLEIQVFLHL